MILNNILKSDILKETEAITYKGFKSPPPGDLPKDKALQLAKIYSGCRRSDVEKDPSSKEDKDSKQKCAKIAWSKIKKENMLEQKLKEKIQTIDFLIKSTDTI